MLPLGASAAVGGRAAVAPSGASAIHAPFTLLLRRYVARGGVRYAAWKRSKVDRATLSRYIDRLEASDTTSWSAPRQLAFWIDLYNAATIDLILAHYPLKSIKDIGGPDGSPWKRKLVRVADRDYTLDEIEKDVIREKFGDPRVHFALNCGAAGCPPLAPEAYVGEHLDAQLDTSCSRALHDARWVEVQPHRVGLSRLFDWYREDFEKSAGAVPSFIDHYRNGFEAEARSRQQFYLPYDWRLNETR